MGTLSDNEFYKIFIINPDSKAKKMLESKYSDNLILQTIFADSANVFMEVDPIIPSESMYHTFLLDENNKVILVGNLMFNKQIEDMMLSIVEEKLEKSLIQQNRLANNE